MLNNEKLNNRLKKIFKYLRENWGIKRYRIALETNISHSSLKYMIDEKFEWKLNHLLSIIDFLNRNNVKISLDNLLDFENSKTMSQIMNTENADFRKVIYSKKKYELLTAKDKPIDIIKSNKSKNKPRNFQKESESLVKEIAEDIKESSLYDKHKISFGLKISGKNFNFHKDLKFSNGKQLKN
jgi:hypothetical protein